MLSSAGVSAPDGHELTCWQTGLWGALLLELKGKLAPDLGLPVAAGTPARNDILQALVALGYSDKEAAAALKQLPPDVDVSQGIKLALKALSP